MVDRRSVVAAFVFPFVFLLVESTFAQVAQQRLRSPLERAALLQLRSSLGLRARDWPIKEDPCLVWNGIECQNGTVTGINVSGLRRTRLGSQTPQFAVDSLVNLTNLVSFNASRFLLPGSIPDWFGLRLLRLQVLDLSSCSVRSAIPSNLGNLTSLSNLHLSDNRLTGDIPFSLGQLSRLSVLNLSRNLFDGSIPASFVSLGNLTSLDLSSNFLSGSIPAFIGSLARLQSLNLSNNSLTSSVPPELGNLSSLNALDLSLNSLSGSLPGDWRGLRNLQTMVVSDNSLAGSLPADIFSSQSRLQVIILRHNNFSGNLPNALWSMSGLNLLDVSGNNFTGLLPNSALNTSRTAAELNISQNLFYGNLTAALRRFFSVDLSGNYFEGQVPDDVGRNASFGTNCLQNVSNQRTLTECVSFYADRGLTFDNFGRPNSSQPGAPQNSGNSNRRTIILAAVLGGVGFFVLLGLLLLLVLFACRKRTTNQGGNGVGPVPTTETPPQPGVSINFSSLGDAYTYQQLLDATSDFSDANLIKHGHSGELFRGLLEGGLHVVIKRINLERAKREAYLLELDLFSKVSHPRLVPLLGHCLEKENEKFLVYKYMPNGDLSCSLFRKSSMDDDNLQSLDWITRLKIATGAAEVLTYLHHECTPPLVHRDVQASSILLDDKFEVRLGSLSEVCAQEGDGHQSRITKFLRFPQSSEQGSSASATAMCTHDVYCFGKVLLELVTGKLGISASSDDQTKEWFEQTLPYISIYDKELVTKIVDPSLIVDDDLLEEVWAIAIVARSCLNPKPSRRPLMRYIVKALENPLKVVREENSGSARLRTTSSRGSWNAALFGSWRHSSSDVAAVPSASMTRPEAFSSLKPSGTAGSQGSGQIGTGEHSSSRRRYSKEICPEPSDEPDIET